MAQGHERLACVRELEEAHERLRAATPRPRLIRSHTCEHESVRARRRTPQRGRLLSSPGVLIMVSAILVPIVTQIESACCKQPARDTQPVAGPDVPPGRPSSPSPAAPLGAIELVRRQDGGQQQAPLSEDLGLAKLPTPQSRPDANLAAQRLRTPGGNGASIETFQQLAPSPLSRALEATRMFMRHHHNQMNQNHPAATSQSLLGQVHPRFPLIQSLVNRGNELRLGQLQLLQQQQQQQPQVGSVATGGGANTTTGRLMQLLFQPKGVQATTPTFAAGGGPQRTREQAAIASRGTTEKSAPPHPRANDTTEPIQVASSDSSYERAPADTTWPQRLPKDTRSLVTLSAPYERVQSSREPELALANRGAAWNAGGRLKGAPGPVNLITSASRSHLLTASLSHADSNEPEEQASEASGETGPSESEQQQQQQQQAEQEPEQAHELYYLEPQPQIALAHAEDEQHEQQPQHQEHEQQQQQQQQQQDSQMDDQAAARINGVYVHWNSSSVHEQQVAGADDERDSSQAQPSDELSQSAGGEELQSQHEQQQQQQQQQQRQQLHLQLQQEHDGLEAPGPEVSLNPQQANETYRLVYVRAQANDSSLDELANGRDRDRLRNTTTSYLVPVTASEVVRQQQEQQHQEQHEQQRQAAGSLMASLQLADEGSPAVQLPSQYESVIRVPPEGHYDDYFKLMGGAGAGGGNSPSLADEQAASARLVSASSSTEPADSRSHQNATGGEQHQHQQQQMRINELFQQQLLADHEAAQLEGARAATGQLQRPAHPSQSNANATHMIAYEALKPAAAAQGRAHGQQLYQLTGAYQNETQRQVAPPDSSGGGGGGNYSALAGEQDNIQLIVANAAGNSHDPSTNEKVITYTSEGARNFARLVGKPARHTFFNKDLNESPPQSRAGPQPQHPPPSASSTPSPIVGLMPARQAHSQHTQTTAKFRSTRSPSYLSPAASSTQRSDDNELEPELEPEPESGPGGVAPEEGVSEEAGLEFVPAGQFGQYAPGGGQALRLRQAASAVAQKEDRGRDARVQAAAKNYKRQRQHNDHRANHRPAEQQVPGADKTQRPGGKSAGAANSSRQQTVRRPQVTEAKFELHDLALAAPTATPSVGASTVKSIAELPEKVKRVRDRQVDKNELMNELLTALDRVKAAIYKLQPLTAKMNAMYRKSVTSNTRDQILDNNKGTYSKRYPPGDFDDTYDRMHPSELLEHQQRHLSGRSSGGGSASANGREGRTARATNSTGSGNHLPPRRRQAINGTRDNWDQEPSGSKAMAVYVPAPAEMLLGESGARATNETAERALRTSTGSAARRAPEVTSAEERRRGRLGGARLRGRLSLRSAAGGEIIYDDDDENDDGDNDDAAEAGEPNSDRDSYNHLLGLPRDRTLSKRMGDGGLLIMDEGSNNSSRGAETPDAAESGPLFGYRITIYQSPAGDEESAELNDTLGEEQNRILTYSLIDDGGVAQNLEDQPQVGGASRTAGGGGGGGGGVEGDDLLATSESSLVHTGPEGGGGGGENDNDEGELQQFGDETSESAMQQKKKKLMAAQRRMKKKQFAKEEEQEEKGAKGREKEHKKGAKWAKHEKRGKKGEEEHKKKKEFKKIKHHKGLVSKESHKLHRDKHIKAHDRGAAKEKALKERTQIEFFEREQIVDDEFEKGKKSTVKAGWASGHDAKKSSLELGGGGVGGGGGHDSMSMGGSQYVNHLERPPGSVASGLVSAPVSGGPAAAASAASPMLMAATGDHGGDLAGKGQGHSSELSSGKQSNKYEKRHMEARGKKFKGWREKGYKIITETEFIDRGSLHDSAYKKRDKGAAHHQKFKKHEAKSEGHQGSMHEHHKKSHKKEEKKSKMEEKKKELSGKEGAEERAKKRKKQHGLEKEEEEKKKKKKKKLESGHTGEDYDQEESAPSGSSLLGAGGAPSWAQSRVRAGVNTSAPSAGASAHMAQATTLKPTILVPLVTSGTSTTTTTTTTSTSKPQAGGNQANFQLEASERANLARHQYALVAASHESGRRNSNAVRQQEPRTGSSAAQPAGRPMNATLLELINRLSPNQARVSARVEGASPLLRLVSTLAKLDNQQRQMSAAAAARHTSGGGSEAQDARAAGGQTAIVGHLHPRQQQQQKQQQQQRSQPAQLTQSQPPNTAGDQEHNLAPAGNSRDPNPVGAILPQAHHSQQQQQQPLASHHQHDHQPLVALLPSFGSLRQVPGGAGAIPPFQSQSQSQSQQQQQQQQQMQMHDLHQQAYSQQTYLKPSANAGYLPPPPLLLHRQAGPDPSSPFSIVAAESQPLDGLASFDPFDYEQPADSQQLYGGHLVPTVAAHQQQQQQTLALVPRTLPLEHLRQFNFLTD